MALPTYASPLERVWYYTYLVICGLVFLFLIAPILIVIPLSFNAEPYFTFTEKMVTFDPEGYSLRWYDTLLTLGLNTPEAPRDSAWWSEVWNRETWVQAAKNSFWVGLWATILATTLGTIAALGLSRPEMPYRRLIMAILISPMIVPIIIIAVGMSFFYAQACVPPTAGRPNAKFLLVCRRRPAWSSDRPVRQSVGCSNRAWDARRAESRQRWCRICSSNLGAEMCCAGCAPACPTPSSADLRLT